MATGEAPVLEALVEINAVSLARVELDPATLLLARIAALVAVDAPPASYLMHVGAAVESGVRLEDVQDVLVQGRLRRYQLTYVPDTDVLPLDGYNDRNQANDWAALDI